MTRLGLSALEQQARDLVTEWCAPHAESTRRDAAGNLYVRFAGERPNDPVVLVGSHADSVPEGGRFDGALGVCSAVEAVISLKEQGVQFKRPVEVVATDGGDVARLEHRLTLLRGETVFPKPPIP